MALARAKRRVYRAAMSLSTDSLAPGFLIASPRLDGSLFERSVILMINHDAHGAMGFIINRPLDVDFGSLLELVDLDGPITPTCYNQDVFFGGPVRVEQLWVMYHGTIAGAAPERTFEGLQEYGEVRFHEDWALSGTAHSIESFAFGAGVETFRPFVGYAGWGPGQLEEEIGEGSWLMLDFDEQFVLDAHTDAVWDLALARLGLDEATFLLMGKAGIA